MASALQKSKPHERGRVEFWVVTESRGSQLFSRASLAKGYAGCVQTRPNGPDLRPAGPAAGQLGFGLGFEGGRARRGRHAHKTFYFEPVAESLNPSIDGQAELAHPEAVPALAVHVQLGGLAGR
jgi:hypothetical protein